MLYGCYGNTAIRVATYDLRVDACYNVVADMYYEDFEGKQKKMSCLGLCVELRNVGKEEFTLTGMNALEVYTCSISTFGTLRRAIECMVCRDSYCAMKPRYAIIASRRSIIFPSSSRALLSQRNQFVRNEVLGRVQRRGSVDNPALLSRTSSARPFRPLLQVTILIHGATTCVTKSVYTPHASIRESPTNWEHDRLRKALTLLAKGSLNPATIRTLLVAQLVCRNATSIRTPWVEVQIALTRNGGVKSVYVSNAFSTANSRLRDSRSRGVLRINERFHELRQGQVGVLW
jgi:hypothetical protein